MKYMGSKNRIAKFILPIMLKEANGKQITTWVEPFVGGANMIDKVPNTFERIGYDINSYLIEAVISIRDCIKELPRNNNDFTESDYKSLRKSDNYKHKGYAGFGFSYSGKWLGGWRRDGAGKRDYVEESYKNAKKQNPLLQNITFECDSYSNIRFKEKSLIYCDPPYESTTKYKDNFNHEDFWEWCRKVAKEGHSVFISEYNAPNDFKSVWHKDIVSSLTKDTGSKKATEKLFIVKQK